MYDIAIIGLGPAGSTLARLLSPSFSILALDKKSPAGEHGFHKPCGGLLATDAQKSLARFGLALPLDLLVDPQIFSVRTIDIPADSIRHYQRFYINLDRHAFDQWLMSLIPPHVDRHTGIHNTRIERRKDGYRIFWREKGEQRQADARRIVGADGAASQVRRLLYPQSACRSYIAIQQWFEDRHPTPFYSCLFDPESTDCYAWGLTKNKHFIFGGAFSPKHGREKFELLKQKAARFGFHLETPIKTEACMVLRPANPGMLYTGRNNSFLIGEAAGFISPSSLEGLSYALDSARKLSSVLNKKQPGADREYFLSTLPLRLKLFSKNLKSPFLYHPFLRRLVMRSGVGSIPVE